MKKYRLTVKHIIERHRHYTWYNFGYIACRKISNLEAVLKRIGWAEDDKIENTTQQSK